LKFSKKWWRALLLVPRKVGYVDIKIEGEKLVITKHEEED